MHIYGVNPLDDEKRMKLHHAVAPVLWNGMHRHHPHVKTTPTIAPTTENDAESCEHIVVPCRVGTCHAHVSILGFGTQGMGQ